MIILFSPLKSRIFISSFLDTKKCYFSSLSCTYMCIYIMCTCIHVYLCIYSICVYISSVQSLSHVQLFATPWTAAHYMLTNFSLFFSLTCIYHRDLRQKTQKGRRKIIFLPLQNRGGQQKSLSSVILSMYKQTKVMFKPQLFF